MEDHLDALRVGAVVQQRRRLADQAGGSLEQLAVQRHGAVLVDATSHGDAEVLTHVLGGAAQRAHMIQVALQGRLAGRGVGAGSGTGTETAPGTARGEGVARTHTRHSREHRQSPDGRPAQGRGRLALPQEAPESEAKAVEPWARGCETASVWAGRPCCGIEPMD